MAKKYDNEKSLYFETKPQVCSCGNHRGLGTSSPYQLAQIYAWFKDKKPSDSLMTPEKYHYLESYEQEHGTIEIYIFGKERELEYRIKSIKGLW